VSLLKKVNLLNVSGDSGFQKKILVRSRQGREKDSYVFPYLTLILFAENKLMREVH